MTGKGSENDLKKLLASKTTMDNILDIADEAE